MAGGKTKMAEIHKEIIESLMYTKALLCPRSWIQMADQLMEAAHLLEIELTRYWSSVSLEGKVPAVPPELMGLGNLQAPYFMLVAYAIENYCKAELVRANEEELRKSTLIKRLPKYLKDHDLRHLVGRLELSLTVLEEELLARLTRCSLWVGRYPVPVGPNGMRNVEQFSDGRPYLLAYFAAPDRQRIHDFVTRLRKRVGAA